MRGRCQISVQLNCLVDDGTSEGVVLDRTAAAQSPGAVANAPKPCQTVRIGHQPNLYASTAREQGSRGEQHLRSEFLRLGVGPTRRALNRICLYPLRLKLTKKGSTEIFGLFHILRRLPGTDPLHAPSF